MKRNIANWDKMARLVLVVILFLFAWQGNLTGVWTGVLIAVGIILLITVFINFCPIWGACGINTYKKKKKKD